MGSPVEAYRQGLRSSFASAPTRRGIRTFATVYTTPRPLTTPCRTIMVSVMVRYVSTSALWRRIDRSYTGPQPVPPPDPVPPKEKGRWEMVGSTAVPLPGPDNAYFVWFWKSR
jgi:hypothetical protein